MQRVQTNRIEIPIDKFVSVINAKIISFKPGTIEKLIDVSPYIQWDNIRLNRHKMTIEKSAKPFDKVSRFAGVVGTIYCKMTSDGDTTIVDARLVVDTALGDVLKYMVGTVIGLSGLMLLILNFSFLTLLVLILIEAFIFIAIPRFQDAALDDLNIYYNNLIEALADK